jgi:uncharacterized membrane protein YeiH
MGGMIRDILAGEPSILMRSELYVTAAALASGLLVALTVAGLPSHLSAIIATLAGLGLRGGSILRGWELPTYKR